MNKFVSFFKPIIKYRLFKVIYIGLLYGSFSFYGQENVDVPEYYYNQINTSISINPAAITDTSFLEVGSFYGYYTGGFFELRNINVYALLRPKRKNTWLFELNSDQQGPVFQKNRFYLGRIHQIKINNSITTQVAGKLGIANYSFKQSLGGLGGSDFGLDGSFGLSVYSKRWLLGAALHQFPSSELQPINQVFKLSRYYEVHGYYIFLEKASDFNVKLGIRSRIIEGKNRHQLALFTSYKSVQLSGMFSNIGCSFSVGYEDLIPGTNNKKMHLSILYQIPGNSNLQLANQNKYEFVLKFFLL